LERGKEAKGKVKPHKVPDRCQFTRRCSGHPAHIDLPFDMMKMRFSAHFFANLWI
jgi:hypothetical protein